MPAAVPVWATVIPGQFDTSALFNAVSAGGAFLTNPPDFVGTQSVAQSIPNTTWTALSLDTSQTDPYGGHSNVTNSSRYVCQAGVPGWYTACGIYTSSGNATGFRAARLQINGATVPGSGAYVPNNGTVESVVMTATRDIFLNVGDYVEVAGYQSSGAALNTTAGTDLRCALWVRFSHA